MSELKEIVLKSWKWRQAHASESWTACKHAKPTTEIFTDLLDVGKIPDPFLDRNERDVQWVGETDWEYATEFTYNPIEGHEFVDLVFEGLDTVATVYLNEERILYSDNMFHSHRVSVTGKVKEGVNSVRILFESAFNHAKKVEQEQGKVLQGFNGDPSRLSIFEKLNIIMVGIRVQLLCLVVHIKKFVLKVTKQMLVMFMLMLKFPNL